MDLNPDKCVDLLLYSKIHSNIIQDLFFGNVGRGMETLQKYRLFLIITLESSTKINLFSPTYLSHIKCPIHHNKQTHHMFCAKYPQGQLFVHCSKKGTEVKKLHT